MARVRKLGLFGGLMAMTTLSVHGADTSAQQPGHPRLYFTSAEQTRLRRLRTRGLHARIWRNLKESAEWCLTLTPRKAWIAPVSPDPIYENLYDRFYAIMGDLAVTEHLGFAYAFSGDERYGDSARQWTLASCRVWKREADGEPDGGKAYAVSRLLKGVAVGYDIAYDRFTEAERQEVRETLVGIGQKYYTRYFSTPTIAGPDFHTHHAILEWASFGVAALALLNEAPEASAWLEATVKKFEEHLLPHGLAPDGAQTEGPGAGAPLWASTMQYRLFFMDALRRVTGGDLFGKYAKYMSVDVALASIAAEKRPGYSQNHETVVLSPSYVQLDYCAPVLLCLAREYRRSICQYLALWDHSLGHIQQTRYITPHGERLLFELGGYAFLWYDPSVPAQPGDEKLSYHFPSVDEAYLRASWKPKGLLVGVRKGELVVHAGGQPVLIEPVAWREPPTRLRVQAVEDNGSVAVIRCASDKGETLTVELHRPDRLIIHRRAATDWQWWCQGSPVRRDNSLLWGDRAILSVVAGSIANWQPDGYAPKIAVAGGVLALSDPMPMRYLLVTVRPSVDGEVLIEVGRKRK